MLEIVIAIIILALTYNFVNGTNDAANAIATVVSTRVLSPKKAVAMAAFANFAAAAFVGTHVAKTIGKGLVDPAILTQEVILTAIIGAVIWGALMTKKGIPISISHSLVGGMLGAALIGLGFDAILYSKLFKVVIFIIVAPILGLIGGFSFMSIVLWVVRKKHPKDIYKTSKRLQLFSAFAYSMAHGGNDAQNAMGIITASLFAAGYLGDAFYVPLSVVIASYLAISLGTLLGGWKVVKTMGKRITRLRPINGFAAETAGALVLFGVTFAGIPVSTTHVITSSIMGVGSTRRLSAVRWKVARNIVWAWFLTIPLAAGLGAFIYWILF